MVQIATVQPVRCPVFSDFYCTVCCSTLSFLDNNFVTKGASFITSRGKGALQKSIRNPESV